MMLLLEVLLLGTYKSILHFIILKSRAYNVITILSRQVGDDEYVDMNIRKIDKNTNDNKGPMALILGIFFAIITGFFGGSVGFPINFVKGNSKDIKFLISFAVGSSIIIPITLIYGFCIKGNKISWHLKKCFIPGFLAGIVWNIGNLASLFAIPALGYNVAV